MDPEISAMSAISSALAELDPDARARVLKWSAARFELDASLVVPSRAEVGREDGADASKEIAEDDLADSDSFESVEDLFVAANPQTDSLKVLVVGYWLHTGEGMSTFKSYDVNSRLKNLGHQVSSINKKFDTLKAQSPQLAIQVKKSSASKQAKKNYKLTTAGKSEVESMISGSGN